MDPRLARLMRTGSIGVVFALILTTVVLVVANLLGGDENRSAAPRATRPPSTTTVAPAVGAPSVPTSVSHEVVVEAFFAAWQAADWRALGAMIAGDGARAAAAHAEWWNGLRVESVEFGIRNLRNDGARVVVPFTVNVALGDVGAWRYTSEISIVDTDGVWAVAWTPAVLHPSLSDGDRLVVIPRWAERAPILDVDGLPLVTSGPSVDVGVIPGRVTDRAELHRAFQAVLGVTAERIDAILDADDVQAGWFYELAEITREEYVTVRPELFPVPGAAFRVDEGRETAPLVAAAIVGRTGEITAELLEELGPPYGVGDVVGRSGLERAFERQLAAVPAFDVVRISDGTSGSVVQSFPGPSPTPLATSLSIPVQRAAEHALAGSETPAALVAIDYRTGEIRAAASTPADGFNRALSGLYPPGSTFKVVVSLALLESGLKPDDTVRCPEVVIVSGKEFRNATGLPESMTFEEALVLSCNTAFIEMGAALDDDLLLDIASDLGFGTEPSIGLPAAGGTYAASPDPVVAAAALIGQGEVLASPLHMATVAAAIANGRRLAPTLLDGGSDGSGPALGTSALSDLRSMMRAVVTSGTGAAADTPGHEVAGKTGTAEVGAGESAEAIAWFVGFDGALAFAVVVEGGSSGGSAAAPLVRSFLEAIGDAPVVAAAAPHPCVAAGGDWSTFQGTIGRTGCSEADAIDTPIVKWTAQAATQAWLNSPIVVGDRVIVGSAGSRRGSADDLDGISAFRVADGTPLWFHQARNDVNGLASGAGLVIAAGDEGAVWALGIDTGAEVWRHDAGMAVFGHPLIVDDVVVVGDASGTVWALDLASGVVRWQADLDGAIRGGAASSGDLIYVTSQFGDLAAFNLDGFPMWRVPVQGPTGVALQVWATPTVVDDLVVVSIVGEDGPGGPGLMAFDRYLGRPVWTGSDPGFLADDPWANVRNSPALHHGSLIFGSSLSTGAQAVAVESGEALWVATTDVSCEQQLASVVVMGGLAIQPRPDGSVYAYDAATGNLAWAVPLPIGDEPVSFTDCSREGERIGLGKALEASPAVAPDGTLIVASTGDMIYAIADG